MTITHRLEDLRKNIPDCRLAAFGDLETCLILKAAHTVDVVREELDILCAEGVGCFREAESLSPTGQNISYPREAIVMTATDMRVFVRSASKSDFLAMICPINADFEAVIKQGARALRSLGGNE